MKKPKKQGDNISLKTKKNESPIIIEWINCQTNLMDSIRYLIENEVTVNGIRNLQNHIPAERAIAFKQLPSSPNNENAIENSQSLNISATKDNVAQLNTSLQVESGTSHLSVSDKKKTEETFADDNIDDEDIDSWL
ncbi:hypothetical protein PP175_25005 [Aneurinibacillus sp. Ricciae_BoGa-3]|uniref:hypothetical protein n=1 Tax=Aneurinibacillus sp. Ricciae_BoGa-3 TaxID=3022697 RepID=UPI00233F9184|nr:hypothetical protein [Aneurinibacillus sp. Ricciae_BoGa-3]WCK54492.1 hypothetical protein PP175_25005 [Aneurinibacillus sp. Ricciae_BoGa-3]